MNEQSKAQHTPGPATRLAELILSMNMISPKGLHARQLARNVIDSGDDMLHSLRLIEHATKPAPDDGGHHEAAHEIAVAAIAKAIGSAS